MWAGCVGGTGPGLCRKASNSRNCGNKGTLSRFWTPFPCGPSPTPFPRPSINVSIIIHSIAWNYTIHICNSQWLHNTFFQIMINYLDHIFTCLLILPLFQISSVFSCPAYAPAFATEDFIVVNLLHYSKTATRKLNWSVYSVSWMS